MLLRRIAALGLTALGIWLFWGGLQAVLAFTSRGGDLASALFEPPTSFIRLLGAALIIIGGAMAGFSRPGGAIVSLIGVAIFTALAALMALAGADISLWLDEVLFAVAGIGLVAFILTLRRD
ncbi:MAG: hypothetical protein QNI84_13860 [Henriciella sp.]|nr:hypothetical protein [Henriciella sp.]